jgi:hypothetical protein
MRVYAWCVALAFPHRLCGCLFCCWANPRGNAIRGRPVDRVEQAHSTSPETKNTGNFIGPNSGTVAEITLQRTDTTHDLSSESREAIKFGAPCFVQLVAGTSRHATTRLHSSLCVEEPTSCVALASGVDVPARPKLAHGQVRHELRVVCQLGQVSYCRE